MKVLKRLILTSTTLAIISLLAASAWALSLSFDPSTAEIGVGDFISVDIVVDGLEFDDLAEFNFDVYYDPTVLTFDSYTLGSELTDPFMGQDDWSFGDDGMGTVNLSELSWLMDFSFQPDSFTLATLSFSGSAVGTSALDFDNVILGDPWAIQLQATLASGSIDVTAPVPEPTTMLLFVTGMTGLAAVARRRRK